MRGLLCLLILLVAIPMATAQTVVVHPNQYLTTEGASNNNYPFNFSSGAGRHQQTYDKTQFPGPITITEVSFRYKGDTATAGGKIDLKVEMSTCPLPWNAPSSTFASNIGKDVVKVFDGVWVVPAFAGDPAVPNPFTARLTLTTPFSYDPAKGDLLMDCEIRVSIGNSSGAFARSAGDTGTYRIYTNANPPGTTGSIGNIALITEFTAGGCPTASWNNYPKGYPGTLGVPSLVLSANPVLGTTPALVFTSSSPGNETSLLLYGYTKVIIPGFWGGYLVLSPIGVAVLPAPAPGYKIAIPIPNNPALCGASVLMQVIQSDKGATPAQASSTDGLEMIIGL